ncbi:VanZ family protein [Alkalibacillus aidingensis]|uniref:VanZ family protein n=1 Tax=Alkalibacillus aidingensis TaxID=2747607 RepID=UPI0016603E82|nr:VanZ family protein [Alkalibacillus aidingensis]
MHKWIAWTGVLVWMGLIFYLSHQPATESSELSRGITETIVKTIESVAPSTEFNIANFNHLVRKNAHFFAYLVLGVLVIYALKRSEVSGIRAIVTALVICILYAISDEVHQLFIPGRSGEIRDVIIDSAGSSVGIALIMFIDRLVRRKKT